MTLAKETPTPTTTEAAAEPNRREVKLRIDETEMHSTYANTIRSSSTIDEVILDFGMNMPVPGKSDEIVFKVREQVVMNWRGAKRLALTLANLVRQHEERFGEIDINPRAKTPDNQG